MKNRAIILAFLSIFPFLAFSQTSYNMNGNTTVSGCDLFIYDNGGPTGAYGLNRNDIITITSNDPANPAVEVTILEADIKATDTLFIYNAATPDPAFGVVMGSLGQPWYNVNNPIIVGNWSFRATIQNPTGAITIRFKTGSTGTPGAGFKIHATCGTVCQPISARIDSLLSEPTIKTEADGFRYLDFCPYNAYAVLKGYGEFPYNDQGGYHQTDENCTFIWHVNGETISGLGRDTIHAWFPPAKGADIRLEMKDQRGCGSAFIDYVRVRVSDNPVSSISFPGDRGYACVGDVVDFTTGYSGSDLITVDTIKNTMISSLKFDTLMFIPDGPNCPDLPNCYMASVVFTDFSPTQTIQSVNDIISICATMEHSFIGDLTISLQCPNGQSALLKSQAGGSLFLGHAVDDSGGCDPETQPKGIPWNYCWSENTALGFTYNGKMNTPTTTTPVTADGLLSTGTAVDSTNRINNTKYYHTENGFGSLIGCPLNGQWSLEICDLWGIDDGWIWEWELNLDPGLLPAPWNYDVTIKSVDWYGHGLSQLSPTLYQVTCDEAGLFKYTYQITDNFDCVYQGTDTIELKVISLPTPDLGPDTWICDGSYITLDARYTAPNTEYHWNTGDETRTIDVVVPGDYSITAYTYNDDKSKVCVGADTINIAFHLRPAPDFTYDPSEGCVPLTFSVHDASNTHGEQCSYKWTIGGALTSTELAPSFTISQPGSYDIKLVLESVYGCKDSLTKYSVINVYGQPIADYIATPWVSLISEGGEVIFTNTSSGYDPTDVTWEWDFDDGEGTSDQESPVYVFKEWGDYNVKLLVSSSKGCSDEVVHTVVIEGDLEFPNIITPNGDGINDVFAIRDLNINRENRLTVYDRWGRKVFDQKSYKTYIKDDILYNADTGFNAEKLSDGVYYFVFYYKGYAKEVNYHGSMTIIRD